MARPVISDVLVSRRAELERVDRSVEELVDHRGGGVLLISGEAGVGKSRLVEELAGRASGAGAAVFSGHCVQFGGEKLPAAPFVDILDELATTLDEVVLDAILGPARAELAGLVPALGSAATEQPQLDPGRLMEFVTGVVTRLAHHSSTVLVIEDLHWADRTTRDLIGFMSLRVRSEPVLVVGTYRSDDLHRRHPLLPALAELQRATRPERIDVAPLDLEGTTALVAALCGSGSAEIDAGAIHHRTGGNPFYIEELVAAPQPEGRIPPTLRDVVVSRSLELAGEQVDVLRIASVLGARIDPRVLERLAGADRLRLNDTLRALVERHFLVQDDRHFHFRHELTREVFADELLPGERTELHQRVAETLSDLHPDLCGEIAHHWYHSGDQAQALRSAIAAGRAARRNGAAGEALLHFERALEIWGRVTAAETVAEISHPELLLDAGEMADLSREHRRATDLTRRACDELVASDNVTRAVALVRLCAVMFNAGDSGIESEIDLALDLIADESPGIAVARVMAQASRFEMMAGRYADSVARAEVVLPMARRAGDRLLEANLLNTLAVCRHGLGLPGAIDQLKAALTLAIDVGDGHEIARGYVNLTATLFLEGRHSEAIELAHEGMDLARRRGFESSCGHLMAENAGHSLAAIGRWTELEQMAKGQIDQLSTDTDHSAPTGLSGLARVLIKRGELDRARPLLENDLEFTLGKNYCGDAPALYGGMIELALAEGASEPPREIVESAIEVLAGRVDGLLVSVLAEALRAEAETVVAANYRGDDGIVDRARASADRWLELVDRIAADGPAGPVSPDFDILVRQCRAEHARATSTSDFETWFEVAAGWEGLGRPWFEAYAAYRAAEAIVMADGRSSGTRHRAEDLLRRAHTSAHDLGAEPLLADIEDLASRARLDLEPPTETTPCTAEDRPFGLTRRELEVLDLVAAGHSNGRIGETLFISTKTASVHVSNILRKLGVGNRIEAAAMANALGLTPIRESGLEPA